MSFLKKAIGAAVGYKVYKNHQPPTIVPPPEMVIVGIEKNLPTCLLKKEISVIAIAI